MRDKRSLYSRYMFFEMALEFGLLKWKCNINILFLNRPYWGTQALPWKDRIWWTSCLQAHPLPHCLCLMMKDSLSMRYLCFPNNRISKRGCVCVCVCVCVYGIFIGRIYVVLLLFIKCSISCVIHRLCLGEIWSITSPLTTASNSTTIWRRTWSSLHDWDAISL